MRDTRVCGMADSTDSTTALSTRLEAVESAESKHTRVGRVGGGGRQGAATVFHLKELRRCRYNICPGYQICPRVSSPC